MAYDEELAHRVRALLAAEAGIVARRMMGGLVFMKDGNMLGGVGRNGLLVRVGAEGYAGAMDEPHVGPMEIGSRVMTGFVLVGPDGVRDDADLRRWVDRGLAYAASLPPKK